jgi:hypothetical protein
VRDVVGATVICARGCGARRGVDTRSDKAAGSCMCIVRAIESVPNQIVRYDSPQGGWRVGAARRTRVSCGMAVKPYRTVVVGALS